jgi:hypothetical protein
MGLSLGLAAHAFSQSYTNLAAGKTATASSSETGFPTPDAFDGDISITRWGNDWFADSLNRDSAWIYVDLGQKYTIDSTNITWENAAGLEYYIQVADVASATDSGWTNVAHITDGVSGEVRPIKITPVLTQFVRMRGIKRTTTYGYSMFDFQVWGNSDATTKIIANKFSKKATNSSIERIYLLNGQRVNNYKADLPIWKQALEH